MMNEKIYQEVTDELLNVVPEWWIDLVLRCEIGEASYLIEYYAKNESGNYIKCYDLQEIGSVVLLRSFKKIYEILKAERDNLDEKEQWSNCTLIIKKDGTFKMDFDYTNLNKDSYVHEAIWKYKYLGIMPSRENINAYEGVENYIKNLEI